VVAAFGALLLGHATAQAQTITATSAQDYVTAITDANNTGKTVTVINKSGALISLGGVSLPALTNGGLQVGDGSTASPITGGTITNNTQLTFFPSLFPGDTDTTNIAGGGAVTVNLANYNCLLWPRVAAVVPASRVSKYQRFDPDQGIDGRPLVEGRPLR
jgi:hypothetical protein